MSRNEEIHFSNAPTMDITRSKFKMPHDHKTTFNTGELIPIGLWETLPGDTFKSNQASLVRMATPIYPVMDNAWMDVYYFFVPNRLVWDHWKEFMGENTTSYWTPNVTYTLPTTKAPKDGWKKGTLADYFGIPINVDGIEVDSLPFRAYALIYNEWFRSENLIEPLDINKGDSTTEGSNGEDEVTDVEKGGKPVHVGRLADYFSSALPGPQKGPDVFIPLSLNGSAPIMFGNSMNNIELPNSNKKVGANETTANGGNFYTSDEDGSNLAQIPSIIAANVKADNTYSMYADLTNAGSIGNQTTINQLRQAFAIQKMYEKDARGGSRYTEVIRTHFGVISPDARQQRPEYIGGKRIPINMTQVVQNSATGEVSPQGNTAAYSLTIDNDDMVTKSFTEHGFVMALACVRTDRTYQQGIERHWLRRKREDFYFPALANIGEQYIKNAEIYAQGTEEDNEAFGYQEAWAEYRYKPSRISGEMRSTYETPLDSWHYGDKYDKLPILGKDWFNETRVNVDRTLAVQTQDQFIADFHFNTTWVRPMPIYSVPGLIDHH